MDLAIVAAVIEPHLSPSRLTPPADRAVALAQDLHDGGLLAGGKPSPRSPVLEQAAAVLQCRLDWPCAETIAAALADAGLLVKG